VFYTVEHHSFTTEFLLPIVMSARKRKSSQAMVKRLGPYVPIDPPPITNGFVITHKFRYVSLATNSSLISPVTAGGILCVAIAAGSAVTLLRSIRLDRVEIWGFTANTTIELVPGSGVNINQPQTIVDDVCRDPARPSHIVWAPQDRKFRDMLETDNWCWINHNANDVVDLTFSFTLDVNGNHQAVSTGSAGMTTGVLYQGQPDGAKANGQLRNIHGPNWP